MNISGDARLPEALRADGQTPDGVDQRADDSTVQTREAIRVLLLDFHLRLDIAGFRRDDLQLQRERQARQVAAGAWKMRDNVETERAHCGFGDCIVALTKTDAYTGQLVRFRARATSAGKTCSVCDKVRPDLADESCAL